jgi:hypothetical protein
MLRTYINYPNAQVTIHRDSSCASVRQRNKEGQRTVRLNLRTLSSELGKFSEKAYRFASEADLNDMWLEVNFNDEKFERAIVDYVRSLLAHHHKPFAGVKVSGHC